MDKRWYVVYTKLGVEKKVAEVLSRRQVENFSPVLKIRSGGNNKKEIEISLFKGYVFIRTGEFQLNEIKKIDGVINLVYWKGKPVVVKNSEIKVIRLFLSEYENITIEKTMIGNVIRDNDINLQNGYNIEAPMITIKNKKASVALASLGYIMHADAETPPFTIVSVEKSLLVKDMK